MNLSQDCITVVIIQRLTIIQAPTNDCHPKTDHRWLQSEDRLLVSEHRQLPSEYRTPMTKVVHMFYVSLNVNCYKSIPRSYSDDYHQKINCHPNIKHPTTDHLWLLSKHQTSTTGDCCPEIEHRQLPSEDQPSMTVNLKTDYCHPKTVLRYL
jgi:hypothetical protein